jgi:hypothetical protein
MVDTSAAPATHNAAERNFIFCSLPIGRLGFTGHLMDARRRAPGCPPAETSPLGANGPDLAECDSKSSKSRSSH